LTQYLTYAMNIPVLFLHPWLFKWKTSKQANRSTSK